MTALGVAVACFTDGRGECLAETVASFEENVDLGPGRHWRLIFDDSADPMYRVHLEREYAERRPHPWTILPNARRLGFGGTIENAWRYLTFGWAPNESPGWVYHLEDDFIHERRVDLVELMAVMEAAPRIVQVALVRQAWSAGEVEVGGVIQQRPDDYVRRSVTLAPPRLASRTEDPLDDLREVSWLEHRLFFTTNPSLYRRALCARGWPAEDQSEGKFAVRLFGENTDRVSAYWGDGTPWVRHIGAARAGTGY